MFDDWTNYAFYALICVASLAAGYAYRASLYRRAQSIRSERLNRHYNEISEIIRALENRNGVSPNTPVFSPDAEILLQDIGKRLRRVLGNAAGGKSQPTITLMRASDSDRTNDWEAKQENRYAEEDQRASFNFTFSEPQRTIESTLPEKQQGDFESSLVHLYNGAVDDRGLRDKIWQDYEVKTIGNINAVDQRLGVSVEPEFRESEGGNLYALRDPRGDRFLVLPKFDLTIKKTNFENTMKFVFDCVNFDEQLSFSQIRVIRPAVFEARDGSWELIGRGELVLAE